MLPKFFVHSPCMAMILRHRIHGIFPQNKEVNFSMRSTNMFLLWHTGQDPLKSKCLTPNWSVRNRSDFILTRDTGVVSSSIRPQKESVPFFLKTLDKMSGALYRHTMPIWCQNSDNRRKKDERKWGFGSISELLNHTTLDSPPYAHKT